MVVVGERDAPTEFEFEIGFGAVNQGSGRTGLSSESKLVFSWTLRSNVDTPGTKSRDTQERTFCKWYVTWIFA